MSANALPLFLCPLLPVPSQSPCSTARYSTLRGIPAGDIQDAPSGPTPAPPPQCWEAFLTPPPLTPPTHRPIESAPLSPGSVGGDAVHAPGWRHLQRPETGRPDWGLQTALQQGHPAGPAQLSWVRGAPSALLGAVS